jgi:hypothetical protein
MGDPRAPNWITDLRGPLNDLAKLVADARVLSGIHLKNLRCLQCSAGNRNLA